MLSTETEKYLEVGGLKLRVWDVGAGPAVVLVHGIGASLEYWRYTVPALAGRHRVLAIDLPGCGFSERGETIPTLPETADLLTGLLDALGLERASLIGASMGGLVCLETALRYPDRVERLILSNSAGLGREVSIFWRLVAVPPIGRALIGFNRLAARQGWLNMFYHPRSEPEIVERCRRWTSRPDLTDTLVEAAVHGLDLGGQRPEIVRVDRLAELTMPTLIVWGDRDWVIPLKHGERARRLIPNARFEVIERCAHCPQLERPQEFNRLATAFLSGSV